MAGGLSSILSRVMAMFGNSGSAGPASNGFAMPGAGGTPSLGALSSSLPSFINPSQIVGVSTNQAAAPSLPPPVTPPSSSSSSGSSNPLSGLLGGGGGGGSSSKAGGAMSGALSGAATGAMLGSVVPGIGTVAGALGGGALGGLSGLMGSGSSNPAPAPTPYQPKPVAPMNLPSLTAAPPSSALTPLSSVGGSSLSLPGGGGGNQSLSQLIQSLMAMKGAG